MINVLHIINGWPAGGIAEQTYLLCKHLPKDKFKQYSIGYCHFDGVFVKKFEEVGVPCLKSDENYTNLEQIIKENNINIVHKQTGGGDFPNYCKLLKKLNIPLVESLHCPRKTAIPTDMVDAVIYTTEYTKQKNRHCQKMHSIQYALDLKAPIFENKIQKKDYPFIVGRLGRVVPDKRPDVLLDLAEKCYEQFGDKIQFHIAGQIPQDHFFHIEYGREFLKQVENMPNVEYFGYIENKYEFWKTLDVCINPVQEASFDIVFLEAMACGIPILTWDNSAAKWVVEKAGIVSNEDLDCLFRDLVTLLKDVEQRKKMGEKGIEYIKEKYSLEKMIRKYSNLYEELFNNIKKT